MALNQKEITSLKSKTTAYERGCGEGLRILVEAQYEGKEGDLLGGGKYFKGRYRDKECWIGREGKGSGEYTLKTALEKWRTIKSWCKETGRPPKDFYYNLKLETDPNKTLKDAVDGFLIYKTKGIHAVKEVTLNEYKNKLYNQVLTKIDGRTLLSELTNKNNGRQIIMKVISKIEDGKKYDLGHRCRKLLCQTFDFAIIKGWMKEGDNPAQRLSCEKLNHSSNHHPAIDWDEVPELLKLINLNKNNAHIQTTLSVKLLLMTFLRAGALTRLEWDWIDDGWRLLTIPPTTSGLKRTKGKNDDIPHHVPLTKEMKQILSQAKEFSGGEKYIFQPIMQSQFPHLDPSTPNNFLKNLGFRNKLRAHGWRRTALTAGIDVLKGDREVIRRQMGHLPEGKVLRAYDGSLLLDERRQFLEKWCGTLVDMGLKV